MGFLDFIFPKYCVNCKKIGDYLCPDCFSYLSFDVRNICLACKKGSFNSFTHPRCEGKFVIDGVFASLDYNKLVQKLIYQFKYKPYLSDLKTVLCDLMYEGLIQNEGFQKAYQSGENFILSPIPLHASKLHQRGYNQSQILACGLAKKLNIPVQNLLIRTKITKAQFGLNKKERADNIAGAFEAVKRCDTNIFLVDDVLTTGSTFLEAARTLKKAGAKAVFGLALARD